MIKAISKIDLQLINSEVPICMYSAVDTETSFKQFSRCHNKPINYIKVCSECKKELTSDLIYKAVDLGTEFREIDEKEIKSENGNLRFVGLIDNDNEQNGIIKNGNVWFIGTQIEAKNKDKTNRNLIKFKYLVEALRQSTKYFVCEVSMRGKEHLVIVKPYLSGFIAVGLYNSDLIRNIMDINGYSDVSVTKLDDKIVKQMAEKLNEKPIMDIKEIKNKRNERIKNAVTKTAGKPSNTQKENPIELVSF